MYTLIKIFMFGPRIILPTNNFLLFKRKDIIKVKTNLHIRMKLLKLPLQMSKV